MRFFFPVLFIVICLPAFAGPVNCEKAAIQGLIKEHVKPKNINEYEKALYQMKKGSQGGPQYLSHLKGDYQFVSFEKVPCVKVVSGLHTNEGLEFLKLMRPDIAHEMTVKVLPNGVQLADIPKAALSEKRLQKAPMKIKKVDGKEIIFTQHTLFPKAWSQEEIVKAVNNVKSNRASLIEVKADSKFITGYYNGVRIRLIVREGQIRTAFPIAN